MTRADVKEILKQVVREQLDDCGQALVDNDLERAKSELSAAIRKLKRLVNSI